MRKQLNIDIDILHQLGPEFDIKFKYRIKSWSLYLKKHMFGSLLKFGTPCIITV